MCVLNFVFTFIAQNLLPPNPWGSIEPRLRTTDLDTFHKRSYATQFALVLSPWCSMKMAVKPPVY